MWVWALKGHNTQNNGHTGNNNDVLTDFKPFLSLYTLQHTSVGLTSCISIVLFSLKKMLTLMTTMLHVVSL